MNEKEAQESIITPMSEDEMISIWKNILKEAIPISDSCLRKFLYDGMLKPCAVMFLVHTSKYKKDKKWLNHFFDGIEYDIGSTCQANELRKRLEVG